MAFVVFLAAEQLPASKPIQLHLKTTACRAPCVVATTVTVPHHADNRHVAVVWGYADADSRTWDLDAGTRESEFTVEIADLPKGEHTIYAVLLRDHDGTQETFEDSKRVSVQ
jgi:hypothetical protein